VVATTWNPSDCSANLTLSNGNLTVTSTSSTQGSVRTNNSFTTGKIYFELLMGASANIQQTWTGVGFANATFSLAIILGNDNNSLANIWQSASLNPPQQIRSNGGSITGSTPAGAGPVFQGDNSDVVQVCIDFTAQKVWFRVSNGIWDNTAGHNPATGTGGYSFSTLNAGPYFLAFGCNANAQVITANFGATAWLYGPPTGFSGPDSNGVTYAATTKFLGYAVLGEPVAASVTKFLGYAVPGEGGAASVTKFLGYAVPGEGGAASVTKFLGYAIPGEGKAASATKVLSYAVLAALPAGGLPARKGFDLFAEDYWPGQPSPRRFAPIIVAVPPDDCVVNIFF
jgi:hypothetical protein